MNLASSPETVLIEQLPAISRMVAAIARRHALDADVAADLEGWVRLKLVENDYAVLRRFRGESAITTYLTVVVAQLFRDYRAREWGRWRPSASAQRRGTVAVQLETLLYRDRCTVDQALEQLSAKGVSLRRRELLDLLRELPTRQPLRPIEVDPENVAEPATDQSPETDLDVAAANAERGALWLLLSRTLSQLPAEDRIILQSRYWDGLSVADIARLLHLDQKPLYRRIERLHALLRSQLEDVGVTSENVASSIAVE
jgi:RNA polymerase sigma factor for flagellar operon FliA